MTNFSSYPKVGLWKLCDYPEYLSAQLRVLRIYFEKNTEAFPPYSQLAKFLRETENSKDFMSGIQADVFGNIGEDTAAIICEHINELYLESLPSSLRELLQKTAESYGMEFDIAARDICINNLQTSLLEKVERLHTTLIQKSAEFGNADFMARSHLQDIGKKELFANEFAVYAEGVNLARNGLIVTLDYFNQPPSTNGIRLDYLNHSDKVLLVHASIQQVSMQLWRLANDLRLRASGPRAGLCEIVLPAVAPGSSIMPGKLNPVIAEMVYSTVDQVDANHASMSAAIKSGWLESVSSGGIIMRNFIESSRLLRRTIDCFIDKCLIGIEPLNR